MARIKKFGDTSLQNLGSFATFITDTNPNSEYFRITEFKETFTGGKNGFLIEGSEYLMESTEIKIEVLDVNGEPMYYEPGNGIPEYYEGISKVVAIYVYEDTPIGQAKITILGELKKYIDGDGVVRDIPDEWKGIYNVKWEKTFKVNKLLSNEDKVRFYKRPKITVDEIVKPLFSATSTLIQQSGSLNGTPQVPTAGTSLAGFSLPTSYLLTITDSTNWTGSVLNGTIELPNLGVTLQPSDVITNKQLIVSNPYTENGLVKSFTNQEYTASFIYLDEATNSASSLTGSFAKIRISDLTTFVGDVSRVKVFRKSQSEISDFQFVQEISLESNEILVDLESVGKNQETYGLFTPTNLNDYWVSSSVNLTTTFNQNYLYNSVKLDSSGINKFFTSKSIDINTGVEYTLDLNVRLQENLSSNNYLRAFISGSKNGIQIEQEIFKISSSNPYLQKTNINENFIAQEFDANSKLYFEVKGNGWYISDISLRASQETSFSPDEITFIQPIPRTLTSETFDFRFEFYDINNNYIPVTVEATKTFNGGNLIGGGTKSISLVPTTLFFTFDSASAPIPPTSIILQVKKQFLTGSTTITSQSFDVDNNLLSSSQYTGGQFPGFLIDNLDDTYTLTVESFTGSVANPQPEIVVQYIQYTAESEGLTDSVIIARNTAGGDGAGGVNNFIRVYRGSSIRNSSTQSLEIQAIRISGETELDLSSGAPNNLGDIQLHVISGSLTEPEKFINLESALSSNFINSLTAGTLGSGEINYNAVFDRDSINFRRIVYLMSSASAASDYAFNVSSSVLASLVLEDIQDGLDAGVVLSDADKFGVDPSPKLPTNVNRFIPTYSSATASFYKRGTTDSPISCSFQVYPSMSLNNDFAAEYWLNYVTQSCDPNITIVVYDEFGNVIPSRADAASYAAGTSANQNKQLIASFTYTEPFTNATVSVDKLFSIVPDGLLGEEPITFVVNPTAVVINTDENGTPTSYTPSITTLKVKQGNRFLIYDSVGANQTKEKQGTYYVVVTGDGIVTPSSFNVNPLDNTEVITQPISNFTQNLGKIKYGFTYQPYYTSSVTTEFVTQSFSKIYDGAGARSVVLTSTTNTVTYDGDDVIIKPEGSIILNATAYNTTGSAYFQFYKDDVELTPPTSINFGGDVYTLSSGDIPAPDSVSVYKVTLRDGTGNPADPIVAENTVTIAATKSGTKAYNVQLTNENTSVFVDVYDTPVFTGTGTTILATKGGTPLTAVTSFSSPTYDQIGTEIPNGQYKVTIDSKSSHITLAGGLVALGVVPVVSGKAVLGDITAWADFRDPITLQPDESTAEIVFKVDVENGKAIYYKTQSLSVQYEGAIGPGVVVRGVWSNSIDYIYDVAAKRRDAVIWPDPTTVNNETHYWASKQDSGPSNGGAQEPDNSSPYTDTAYWQYLGEEEFFVAAKIAIFEESFVKNTINVGNNGGANAFANIVLAGGRIDPYIAIGQTGTQGTSGGQEGSNVIGYNNAGIFMGTKYLPAGTDGTAGKYPMVSLVNTGAGTDLRYLRWNGQTGTLDIAGKLRAGNAYMGYGVNGTNNGLYIDANNYWYDTGTLKVGNATNYLEWNGSTLTLRGSIKQTAAGVNEPVLKGAWTSATLFFNNDVVSYSGQSWICTSAVSHTSTNDTNATTGYPGSGPWNVYIAKGAGVVYRGAYNSGTSYIYTEGVRRDVVTYSGAYYVTKANTTGNAPTDTTYWESFGGSFSSVATDILFAQEVYTDRTVNVGSTSTGAPLIILNSDYTNGNANPYISINQTEQGYEKNGIYLGFNSGSGKFSLKSAVGSLKWDGSNLIMDGIISASSGRIGTGVSPWIIDTPYIRATSSAGEIKMNSVRPAFEIFDSLKNLTVDINTNSVLSSVNSINIFHTGSSVSGEQWGGLYTDSESGLITDVEIAIAQGATATSATVTESVYIPNSAAGNVATFTIPISGDAYASFELLQPSSPSSADLMSAALTVDVGVKITYLPEGGVEEDVQTLVVTKFDITPTALGGGTQIQTLDASYNHTFTVTLTLKGPGVYRFKPYLGGYYASAAANTTAEPPRYNHSLSIKNIYASSQANYDDADGSETNYPLFPTIGEPTYTVSTSKTEIIAGGLQVVYDKDRYVQIPRTNTGAMLKVKGGIEFTSNTTSNVGASGDLFGTLYANDWTNNTSAYNTNTNYTFYSKQANGMIIQAGYITDTGNPVSISFPLTFPNKCYAVVCSTNRDSLGAAGGNHVDGTTLTTSGVDLWLDNPYDGWWMAIGR